MGIERAARRQPGNRKRTVFDRRDDIVKFLAVAEAGKIGAAAQRLTPLGETAAELERGPLREIDSAAEKFDAVIRGRTGS